MPRKTINEKLESAMTDFLGALYALPTVSWQLDGNGTPTKPHIVAPMKAKDVKRLVKAEQKMAAALEQLAFEVESAKAKGK